MSMPLAGVDDGAVLDADLAGIDVHGRALEHPAVLVRPIERDAEAVETDLPVALDPDR